jgi:hypothetical protein
MVSEISARPEIINDLPAHLKVQLNGISCKDFIAIDISK